MFLGLSGRTNGVQGCFRGLSWDQSTGPPSMWLAEGNGPTRPGPSATLVVPRHWPNRPGPSRPGRSVRCRVWEVGLEGLAQPAQCSREASRGRGHTDHARAALFYPTWACRREGARIGHARAPIRPSAMSAAVPEKWRELRRVGGWLKIDTRTLSLNVSSRKWL